MKTLTCLLLGAAMIALAGCSQLPGSSLGATFGAESYLKADRGGAGFTGALAKEYTEIGRRAAFHDVRWLNATAYVAKARQAEAGTEPAPWAPEQLGVGGDATSLYQTVVAAIGDNKAARPAECARAQAMWDQYLEALRGGEKHCITPDDARALLDEALGACGAAVESSEPPQSSVPSNYVVYFDFDRTDLTERAMTTLDKAVSAVQAMSAKALSIIGHADTSGPDAYNQKLSERRARRVADALTERGVASDSMTLAGRGERNLARATADNVREPLNRRVEITLSP